MNNRKSFLTASSFLFALSAASAFLCAQSTQAAAAVFGPGAPAHIEELPAGDFRRSLESLPSPARQRALSWLQVLEFPAQDLQYMQVDKQGSIYYADTFDSGMAKRTQPVAAGGPPAGIDAGNVFKLHSNPGAGHTIFVDFDGGVVSGSAWNETAGVPTWKTRSYDTDGEAGSFSTDEIGDMVEIWQRVADDYAPFDVDVTTEDPGKIGPNTGWILVTHSEAGSRHPLPAASAGGAAYFNTFGYRHASYFSPIFVYYNNLNSPAAVAHAASHEMGHNLSLSHDGSTGATGSHGAAYRNWAPVMGLAQNAPVTQWSRGKYRGANNTQDDLGILTGALGLRRDDHEDSRFGTGTQLVIDGRGNIQAGNPVAVLKEKHPVNRGVIEERDDVDVFVFAADAGTVDITVAPGVRQGSSLDIDAVLYNAAGKKLAENNPRGDAAARLRVKVPGGRYILEVKGVGDTSVPDSDYGSIGQFLISGSVPASRSQGVAMKTAP
ncbi:MAG: hypothetical protein PVJ15_03195 [Gammaproteobacteria bacterium]|jgi:hypothetical protein